MAPGDEVIQAILQELKVQKVQNRMRLPIKHVPPPPRPVHDNNIDLPLSKRCFYCESIRNNDNNCPHCGAPSTRNKYVFTS